MKEFEFKGKRYMFSEDITPNTDNTFQAVAVNQDNVRCELTFKNRVLCNVRELD